jgi:cathepsin L
MSPVLQLISVGTLLLVHNGQLCAGIVLSDPEDDVQPTTFASFCAQYGREYEEGSDEYTRREKLFDDRVSSIQEHNSAKDYRKSWRMGVSHMSDWTDDELNRLRGYRSGLHSCFMRHLPASASMSVVENGQNRMCAGAKSKCSHDSSHDSSATGGCCSGLVCGLDSTCTEKKSPPSHFDWALTIPSAKHGIDQKSCGSCWACATTFAVQMHASLVTSGKFSKSLSAQNFVDCVPNKLECGGGGGCNGSTPELALEWLKSPEGRLEVVDFQEYKGVEGSCQIAGSDPDPQLQLKPAVQIKNYAHLPENDVTAMLTALVTVGPLVSNLASPILNNYFDGVITGCNSYIVDHSVVMMGYGHQTDGTKYWKLRNSWGEGWGESGFFRLKRFWPDPEPCDWNTDPEKGVACKDKAGPEGKYPSRTWACGACGVLADTSYPQEVIVPQALWDSSGSLNQNHF